MPAFATLGDLKRHLNKSTTADDDELLDMLDAAEERVRSLLGGTSFDAVTVTERVSPVGGQVLLSRRPVVGSVTINGAAILDEDIDREAGIVYGIPTRWSSYATATYSTGGGVVPASVKLATLIIAAHLWDTQRGTTQTPLDADTGAGYGPTGAGYAIPNRARELLEPFIGSRQIA